MCTTNYYTEVLNINNNNNNNKKSALSVLKFKESVSIIFFVTETLQQNS